MASKHTRVTLWFTIAFRCCRLLSLLPPSPSPPHCRCQDCCFYCYRCCFLVDWCLSPAAASVSVCWWRCLPPPLPPLSAGAIANDIVTATTAPVPSAITATTSTYFSAAITTASMFQRFQLPQCLNITTAAAAPTSVSVAHHFCFRRQRHSSFRQGTITDKKC